MIERVRPEQSTVDFGATFRWIFTFVPAKRWE